jgi:hypothetical protein
VSTPDPEGVFINAPFDAAYEPLFITLVGMLVFLGQKPRCVLEIREQGDGRLARILELVRACRISVHDLSRVSTPVRFNMPFELGIACALKLPDGVFARCVRPAERTCCTRRSKGLVTFVTGANLMKSDVRSNSLFRPSLFRSLVAAARGIAIDFDFIQP